ncbi:putative nuclease HARBI1 [Harpegnathos saltator]|uniref:putative nuclease HARBI1 n=1 Tax=Harpegnathos saltator TaxID=610380 RepID=UPI000DBEE6BE|nr:putative nuclease HARBI1 [Harpegnathos saltator]
MRQIEEEFYAGARFPGVIGAIDSYHIQISAPTQDTHSYVNWKGYHSILLQGICDSRLKFIDVFIGLCGSAYDARIWELSEIKTLAEANDNRYFNSFYHLLADSAYPLSNRMLTPYRDNGHLNQMQINYNRKHTYIRVIIERTFGILTGRFRKLKYIYMYATELIPLIVLACCILHNICIDFEGNPIDIDGIDLEEINNEANNIDLDGNIKRDIIAHLLL